MPICLSALFRVSCAARSASSVFGICLSRFSLRRMFCFAVSICAFSSPICVSAICSCSCAADSACSSERPGSSVSKALRRASTFSSTFAFCAAAVSLAAEAAACASSYAVFAHFTCSSVGACSDSTAGRGCSTEPRPGRGFRACGCLQECPPARPEMPAASGCMPEAARLPPVPARDTPFVFLQCFLLCMQVFIIRDQIFQRVPAIGAFAGVPLHGTLQTGPH